MRLRRHIAPDEHTRAVYRGLTAPLEHVSPEQLEHLLPIACQLGREAAQLVLDQQQLEAAATWEYINHVVEAAAAAGLITQAEAWEWAADSGSARVREDPRVRAFLEGWRGTAAK